MKKITVVVSSNQRRKAYLTPRGLADVIYFPPSLDLISDIEIYEYKGTIPRSEIEDIRNNKPVKDPNKSIEENMEIWSEYYKEVPKYLEKYFS